MEKQFLLLHRVLIELTPFSLCPCLSILEYNLAYCIFLCYSQRLSNEIIAAITVSPVIAVIAVIAVIIVAVLVYRRKGTTVSTSYFCPFAYTYIVVCRVLYGLYVYGCLRIYWCGPRVFCTACIIFCWSSLVLYNVLPINFCFLVVVTVLLSLLFNPRVKKAPSSNQYPVENVRVRSCH